ncbi:MAG TPA: SURF1 family protein [Jiangellaceae bacterium]|nr:SURF1 family protein [Jiangellaceae bacterium]
MFRFLASRRWLVRTLAGLVLVLVFVRLGVWQLDRAEQRSERNAVVEANVDAAPVPADELLEAGEPIDRGEEWRQVELTGRYDVEHQLVLRLRPLDGNPGVHVLTPLVGASGTALLVDRGFVAVDGPATEIPDVPAPPAGEVDVIARVRQSEEGRGTGGDPAQGRIRYIDVEELAGTMPYAIYGAWSELISESPEPAQPLTALPPPSTDAGPHLSYAIQWFLFACIGIGGFIVLVRAEARGRRELEAEQHAIAGDGATSP